MRRLWWPVLLSRPKGWTPEANPPKTPPATAPFLNAKAAVLAADGEATE